MSTQTPLFETTHGLKVSIDGDYVFCNWLTTNGGVGSIIRLCAEHARAGKPLKVTPGSGILADRLCFDTLDDVRTSHRVLVEYRLRDELPSVRDAILADLITV